MSIISKTLIIYVPKTENNAAAGFFNTVCAILHEYPGKKEQINLATFLCLFCINRKLIVLVVAMATSHTACFFIYGAEGGALLSSVSDWWRFFF